MERRRQPSLAGCSESAEHLIQSLNGEDKPRWHGRGTCNTECCSHVARQCAAARRNTTEVHSGEKCRLRNSHSKTQGF